MRPKAPSLEWRRNGLRTVIPKGWRLPLAQLALAWAFVFALTAADWMRMAYQWWNISTYNHILFVPLIVGWLVWVRREEIAKLTPQGWWPGLLLFAGAGFVWLVGSMAGINLVCQAGAVGMLQASVMLILGPKVSAALLFPLFYMIFLVPFGDELVPMLQMITADLVIALTEWSGIPAHIEGVFIDTPVGLFEVAEACSGVKFLIAMIALGTLVANVCFTRWSRRIVFFAAAIALPILANGVRAWGTIYIAQSQGIDFAEGFDHVFYGWVFFALVVGLLFAAAWRFFDRDPDDISIDAGAIDRSRILGAASRLRISANSALAIAAMMAVILALWNTLATHATAAVPEQVFLPEVEGWERVDYRPQVDWEPRAAGADHRLIGRYRNAGGQEVDVFLAVYAWQGEGKEAGAMGEGALVPDTPWRWLEPGPSTADSTADYLLANGNVKRLAHTTYRSGNILTGSNARLKLASIRNRLALDIAPTTVLIISAEENQFQQPDRAIAAFRSSIDPLDDWMDAVLQER